MLYATQLTIPANTTEANPATVDLGMVPSVIKEVQILFPTGCKGLVGVRVKDWEHIIFPNNEDSWIVADGETVDWYDDQPLAGNPNTLTLEGYNSDDTYPHTIYFRFATIEAEKASLSDKFWGWVKAW